MSLDDLSFKTKSDFIQAAFEQVAKIVFDHSNHCLESLSPAISAEKCLKHLGLVSYDWSYDSSKIDAYADILESANQELLDAFGEDHE